MPLLQWAATGSLSSANALYRILSTPNGNIFATGDDGFPHGYIWKSTNSGTSWIAISLATIAEKTFDITYKDNNNLFVSNKVAAGCSAAKSINAGSNWSDLPDVSSGNEPHCILYDIDNSILYMGVNGSTSYIYKSINDGNSWTTSYTFSTSNENPEHLVKYGNYIYCVTEIGKVYKQESGTDSWSQLATVSNVSTLYTIYVDSDIILIGGKNTSNYPTIWLSMNGGSSWTEYNIHYTVSSDIKEIIKVGNYYVLCGLDGTEIYISTDGISWIKSDLSGSGSDINSIASSGTDLYVNRGTTIYKADVSSLFIANVPQNITCTPGTLKNTLEWDSITDATSYNLYLTKNKEKNEYFDNDLSRWTTATAGLGSTVTLSSEKLHIDVPDGLNAWGRANSNFTLINNIDEISIDLVEYNVDDNNNGLWVWLRLVQGVDYAIIKYSVTGGGSTHNIQYIYLVNSVNTTYNTTVPGQPTKLKITRNSSYFNVHAFVNGEWYDFNEHDFGSRVSNPDTINIQAINRSLHGGDVYFDNLIIKPSIKEFEGDSLSETFENLDDWTTYIGGAGGTATIVSNQLVFDIPDAVDEYIYVENDNTLPEGSFEYDIDIISYSADVVTDGIIFAIILADAEWGTAINGIRVMFGQLGAANFFIRLDSKVNSVTTIGTNKYLTSYPTKFKIIKSNDIFYIYYYDGSNYLLSGKENFDQYSGLVTQNILITYDDSLHGGSVTVDNMIITSPGTVTKISGITAIPYDHITVDDDEYIYNITSENGYGESKESVEVFGSPTLLTIPQNVAAVAGIEQVTITWDSVIGADSYNIYWDTSPGVTTLDNKIEGVTSPYIHQDLGDYTYYYIVTAISGITESTPSSEVSADPWYGPPAGPTGFRIDTNILPDSECTLLWDTMDWTDSYNIYYLTQTELNELTRVKKTIVSYKTIMTYGTKLENVSSLLNLIDLTAENYYFIVVGVNIIGEGIPDDILIVKILFEGKIFNHTELMLNRLLQQYKID